MQHINKTIFIYKLYYNSYVSITFYSATIRHQGIIFYYLRGKDLFWLFSYLLVSIINIKIEFKYNLSSFLRFCYFIEQFLVLLKNFTCWRCLIVAPKTSIISHGMYCPWLIDCETFCRFGFDILIFSPGNKISIIVIVLLFNCFLRNV